MDYRTAICVFFALLMFSGCGTLIHGTEQEVNIQSNPPGASVIIDGVERGQTPVSVELSRKSRHTISVSLFGYNSYQIMVDRKFSAWALLGGPIGILIDDATGGMYKLLPERINAQLQVQGAVSEQTNHD